MTTTFADKRTKDLYDTGRAKRFPPDVAGRAARKLEWRICFRFVDGDAYGVEVGDYH